MPSTPRPLHPAGGRHIWKDGVPMWNPVAERISAAFYGLPHRWPSGRAKP